MSVYQCQFSQHLRCGIPRFTWWRDCQYKYKHFFGSDGGSDLYEHCFRKVRLDPPEDVEWLKVPATNFLYSTLKGYDSLVQIGPSIQTLRKAYT